MNVSVFRLLFAILGAGEVLDASPLTLVQASAAVQSTFADNDLFLLSQFAGFQAGETLLYDSNNNSTGWSGTLAGTYLGAGVTVQYAGNHSAFPGGAIDWNGSGSYGGNSWTGAGNALISGQGNNFQIVYKSDLMVGQQQGSINALIDGTANETSVSYFATSGTLTLNGLATPLPIMDSFELDLFTDTITSDVDTFRFTDQPPFFADVKRIIVDKSTVTQFAENSFNLRNTISTVPESPTGLLLGCGLFALALRLWRMHA